MKKRKTTQNRQKSNTKKTKNCSLFAVQKIPVLRTWLVKMSWSSKIWKFHNWQSNKYFLGPVKVECVLRSGISLPLCLLRLWALQSVLYPCTPWQPSIYFLRISPYLYLPRTDDVSTALTAPENTREWIQKTQGNENRKHKGMNTENTREWIQNPQGNEYRKHKGMNTENNNSLVLFWVLTIINVKSSIWLSIYVNLIVKSRLNPFMELNSTKQWV